MQLGVVLTGDRVRISAPERAHQRIVLEVRLQGVLGFERVLLHSELVAMLLVDPRRNSVVIERDAVRLAQLKRYTPERLAFGAQDVAQEVRGQLPIGRGGQHAGHCRRD